MRSAVRFRVDFGNRCSVGSGKIELLEGIARTGSLSQAAREMHMSYRRAWLLLADLNISFDLPVAKASVGGRGGGGVVLTDFGADLVSGYRLLEGRFNPLVRGYVERFSAHLKAAKIKRSIKPGSLKRKSSTRANPRGGAKTQ